MIAYLDALRYLVQVNLDAGKVGDFTSANSPDDLKVNKAWKAYQVAHKGWQGERIAGGGFHNWPSILRSVEAYVEEKLRAA